MHPSNSSKWLGAAASNSTDMPQQQQQQLQQQLLQQQQSGSFSTAIKQQQQQQQATATLRHSSSSVAASSTSDDHLFSTPTDLVGVSLSTPTACVVFKQMASMLLLHDRIARLSPPHPHPTFLLPLQGSQQRIIRQPGMLLDDSC